MTSKKSINWNLPIFILLMILSFAVVFFKFNQIPKNLAFDEVEFAKLALSLKNKPYIPYSPLATGHSTLYFYILLFFLQIFGVNSFALRLPAAVFGISSVIIFYFLLKLIFPPRFSPNKNGAIFLPFLLSFTLLTSHWYFNFARFAFEATFLLFLELVAIYFLLQLINQLKWTDALWCGIFTGLAFNSYTPGRIFFLLVFLVLLLKLLQKKITLRYFLISAVSFLIVIAPLSFYLLKHQDIRFNQQFFLKNNQLTNREKINFIWKNVQSTALMFNVKGDINGRHNYPNKSALNPFIGFLFLIGLFIAIKNYKKNFYYWFFILYFLISLLPTIFTYPNENPNMLRTFTAIPEIIYFCGVAVKFLFERLKKIKLTAYLLLFLIIVSAVYEIRSYYKYQAPVFDQAFEIKYSLEKAIKMKKLL